MIGAAGPVPTSRVLAIAEGILGSHLIAGRLQDQLREVRLVAVDPTYRESVLRTIRMSGSTRMQSSLALRADVNSVSCAKVTMGIVGIASS